MQTTRQEVVRGRDLGREFSAILPLRALADGAVPTRTAVHAVAERMLLDAAERAQRRGADVEALLLRLSQLPPPGAKPHHRRVARSLLDEAALRCGGQVFALRNLDLVLLGPAAEATRSVLARLFPVSGVVQVLAPGAGLLAYARERAAEHLPLPEPADSGPPSLPDAAETQWRTKPARDFLRVQVAAELLPGGALRALFREALPRAATNDFAAQLDAPTLAVACADLAQGGPLTGRAGGPALHLNLTLSALFSPSFARFAEMVRERGTRAGIELSLIEACADPAAFERARERVRAAGLTLALDGVGHQALLLIHPARLGTDFVKLDWSGSLAAAGPDADQALREIGPARIVLASADSEAAMRWGYARHIRRFQGQHVDALLAASRLGSCAFASAGPDRCTLRLCAERAAATREAGRTGCRNPALLAAATP